MLSRTKGWRLVIIPYGHVSDRMQRESAARMEQYIADVSRMEPKKN